MSASNEPTITPSDFGPLLAGQVYRVAEPFVDFDGVAHPEGETWTFLGHHLVPEDEGLELHVRDLGGVHRTIRLQMRPEAQGAIVDELPRRLERVVELPANHALVCACESAHWTVAAELSAVGPDAPSGLRGGVDAPALNVLVCTTCGIMIAVEATAGGHHMLALDARNRRELEVAITLDPRGALDEVIRAALIATTHPANLIVALKLSERPSFVTEVAARLASPRVEERIPALDLVARMRPAPAILADGVVRALMSPIGDDVVSDERLRVLMALFPLAAETSGFRDEVAKLDAALEGRSGELAELERRVSSALLSKMDAALEAARHARARATREIAELVLDGELEAAKRRAIALEPEERHAGGVPGRAALWEDAGDELAKNHPDAAKVAYRESLVLWQTYASWASAGGEGLERMIDVQRVEEKLAKR